MPAAQTARITGGTTIGSAFAYKDANYGYDGRYIAQDEYNHYFREGFQRGYEDGYYGRQKYGRKNDSGGINDEWLIAGAVVAAIIGYRGAEGLSSAAEAFIRMEKCSNLYRRRPVDVVSKCKPPASISCSAFFNSSNWPGSATGGPCAGSSSLRSWREAHELRD